MKYIVFSFLFIVNNMFFELKAQEWQWNIQTSNYINSYLNDVDIVQDFNGNIFFAGYFQRDFTLDTTTITAKNDTYSDIFLGNLDSLGNLKWLIRKELDDLTYYESLALTIDNDNNICLAARKKGYLMVAKFDTLGNQLWETIYKDLPEIYGKYEFNGNTYITYLQGYGYDINADSEDNLYIIGGGGWDMYLTKLNSSGEILWIKKAFVNSSAGFQAYDLTVDPYGYIYFTGICKMNHFKLGNYEFNSDGSSQTFLGKIDLNGNVLWIKNIEDSNGSNPAIELITQNELFVIGSNYISKYDSFGNIIWLNDTIQTNPKDFVVDYKGNAYITGNVGDNFFIEKRNSKGDLIWQNKSKTGIASGIDIGRKGDCIIIGKNSDALFIASYNSNIPTIKRPPKPLISENFVSCVDTFNIVFEAKGENIKWYGNPNRTNLLTEGNFYQAELTNPTQLYVTQTIESIESWPKRIDVKFSELIGEKLTYNGEYIKAPTGIGYKYQWFYDNDSIENAYFYRFFTDSISGYSVRITNKECSIFLNAEDIEIISNINSFNHKLDRLEFYPNPTTSQLTFKLKSYNINSTDYHLKLIDISGLVLFEDVIEGVEYEVCKTIDFINYPPGLYFLIVHNDKIMKDFKIIKE